MAEFRYNAKSRAGKTIQGTIESDDQEGALAQLRQSGLVVLAIKKQSQQSLFPSLERKKRVKIKDLAVFCRQFAIELNAGLTLVNSIRLLEEQVPDKHLSTALHQIRLDIASGASLTRSVEKHTAVFPTVFIRLVEAGEVAGALPSVLERLAMYYEREDELRKRAKEALMYPGIIVSISLLMVMVLLLFVLPMLVSSFSGFGVEPPPITQAVLAFRAWLLQRWYVVLAVAVAIYFGLKKFHSTARGRKLFDRTLLGVPVLGNVQKMVICARFSHALGLLLNSGVSMVQSLEIMERLISNVIVNQGLADARAGVQRGQGLSGPLSKNPVFPKMLIQIVSVGEETGNLESTLGQLADYYDREVSFTVTSLTKLIEPIAMLVIAVVVLFILISVYLPMMQMVTSI